MKKIYKSAILLLVVIVHNAIVLNPAFAHRFNVVLVIPLSGSTAENGKQIRKGFLLATTQRDAHANEESDGHLGGLDSYVSVIDANGDVAADIKRIAAGGQINIVAAFAPDKTHTLIITLLEGKKIALLRPAQTPFSNKALPAVSAFIAAYSQAYGVAPTAAAAQGYNAARRIDVAVRAQGGVRDLEALRQSFRQTEARFTW